jgi:hypothetical protein
LLDVVLGEGAETGLRQVSKAGLDGLLAETASFCQATNNGSGTGLLATLVIGCAEHAGAGGTRVQATNKYLMP